MGDNEFTGSDLKTLGNAIKFNRSLKYLCLSNCRIMDDVLFLCRMELNLSK